MLYEINYSVYLLLAVAIAWPSVFVFLVIYDIFKGSKFRPFYRAIWPFALLAEVVS